MSSFVNNATQKLIVNDQSPMQMHRWFGGQGVFSVCATAFNAATVKLQYLGPDDTTWLDAGTAVTLTGNGGGAFILPNVRLRVLVTGGTPTGLYASVATASL